MVKRRFPSQIGPFGRQEFERRVERARRLMTRERLDGLLLTSQANLEYLSGFTTQFAWNSPTRPWYFVLPRAGEATAVIPEIGLTNWRATSWVKDVFTWPSPRPEDEGLGLLAGVIGRIRRRFGRLGVELGAESRLGMPVGDFLSLRRRVRPFAFADGSRLMRELRLVKSPAEIARIRHICRIASAAFQALPGLVRPGDGEADVVRTFQARLLIEGADKTPYAAIGSGRGGYASIVMGPTRRRLGRGDVFLIDTGSTYGGYFCDFNRNFAIGPPAERVQRAHAALHRATEAGMRAARPGATAAQVFAAQAKVLDNLGFPIGNVGRFGHGLGKAMTEPPSNKPGDETPLVPGMVLTIEPSAFFGRGRILVHEEDVAVTEDGCELLSRRAPAEMPVIRFD